MAAKITIGGDGRLFIGEDKLLKLFVYDRKVVNIVGYNSSNLPVDSTGVVAIPVDVNGVAAIPIDMTGWTTKFVVRKKEDTADPPMLDKNPSVEGTYHADPLVNTMHLETTLLDDPDLKVTVFKKADTYQESWKRLVSGAETILAYGPFVVERATQV